MIHYHTCKEDFIQNLSPWFPLDLIQKYWRWMGQAVYFKGFSNKEELDTLTSRLISGEPFQYVLGETEFFGLHLKVNSHVLIPRPETEELLEIILRDYLPKNSTQKILDVGTGSGVIPLSLKKNRPELEVSACDISPAALDLAKENAALNQLNINFFQCDFLTEIPDLETDILISNPPYIPAREKAMMEDHVLDFEPHLALFVPDQDPLIFYQRLAEYILNTPYCKWGFFEIHQDLGSETAERFQPIGKVQVLKDMSGNDRFVIVQK